MSEKNEIDRWRRSLEEAEQELEEKVKQFEDMQAFFCKNVSMLIRKHDSERLCENELQALDNVSFDPNDISALKTAVRDLVNKSPESGVISQFEAGNLADELKELKERPDPSQFCAMLISEILYQLLEKISLPQDLSDRLFDLKKQLQKGVTMNKWAGMLTEVSDMASFVQLKISHERLGIEDFLKQVTGRLAELDAHIQGSKAHFERTEVNSKVLGDAVKMEMQSLVSCADGETDIGTLKLQIQNGLSAIEKHIDSYKQTETQQHLAANGEIKILLTRLAVLEKEGVSLKARVQKERMLAQLDTLTGIPNRLGYDHNLAQEYARWKRFGNSLSIVVWDIDHFKRINDDYGHAAGDKALKTIAQLLASKVRETDYLARYGGEEFVLIMPGAKVDSAKLVAEKLREVIEHSAFNFKGSPLTITISAGIAEFAEGDVPASVFERADKALYRAKENGRNQVAVA